jgi:hypothetical protein
MKFKNDIEVQAGIKDSSGSDGTLGQVLSSTVSGVSWITPSTGITGSGTINFVPKWSSPTGLSNSRIIDNGFGIYIGYTSPASIGSATYALDIITNGTGQSGIKIINSPGNNFQLFRLENLGTGDYIQARSGITGSDVFSVNYLGDTTANSFIKTGGTSSQYLMADGSVSTGPSVSGYVPYTGATGNVDLGTHTLSSKNLVVNHASGSGVAAQITKGGNGEALTVVKSSGSGNAASITGGVTLLSELHLNTDLADAYIASAAIWNAKQNALNGTGFVKVVGTTVSYDNSTYVPTSRTITINGTTQNLSNDISFTVAGDVTSVFGRTGVVVAVSGDYNTSQVTENTNLYFTNARSRSAISLTTTGSSGPATYNSTTGVLNIPQYTEQFVGTVTSVGLTSSTSGVTIGSSPITTSGNITLSISTASGSQQGLLSSTDWTTFNNKQNALTNPITGTGTTNFLPKFTGASTLGNSLIFDNGTNVGIGTTSPAARLSVANAVTTTATVMAIGTSNNGLNFIINSNGSPEIASAAAVAPIHFSQGSTRVMTLSDNGNVGIGTTSPSAKLSLAGASELLWFQNDSAYMSFYNTGNSIRTGYIQANSGSNITIMPEGSNALILGAASNERMRITSGGNVGIGTTSPSAKLHVFDSNNGFNLFLEKTSGFGALFLLKNTSTSSNDLFRVLDSSNNVISQIQPATNGINFATGNVGIGTTSPSALLHLSGSSTSPITHIIENNNAGTSAGTKLSLRYNGVETAYLYNRFNGGDFNTDLGSADYFRILTAGSEKMRILLNGNVGIGTTNADARLRVSGTYNGTQAIFANVDGRGLEIATSLTAGTNEAGSVLNARGAGSGTMIFQNDGTERMRITTNGDVCVGTTTANSRFNVTSPFGNTVTFNNTSGSSSASFVSFQASGNPIGGISRNGLANSVLYNTTSDYRLKEDFKNFKGLDLINNINVYNFKWKGVNQREYGVIAHELKEVIPNLVTGEKDAESMQQVDYSKLVPILIQAIQDQQKQIEELKTLINK